MQFTFGKIQIELTPAEMKEVHDEYEKLLASPSPQSNTDFESAKIALESLDKADDYGDKLPWDDVKFPISDSPEKSEYNLYVDGLANGLNHGGWRAELRDEKGNLVSSDYDIDKDTNAGQMKLKALVVGAELVPIDAHVKIHFDSQAIIDVITSGKLEKWASDGWMREGVNIKNKELWERLYENLKLKEVEFVSQLDEDEASSSIIENIKTVIILDIKRIAVKKP